MRTASLIVLVLALLLAACSFPTPIARQSSPGGQSTSPSAAATPRVPIGTPASGEQASAIKEAIRRANEAQQQAFEQRAPTMMRDTATDDYYQQLLQIYDDLNGNGVSDIQLISIEWGDITLTSATDAQATTFETWQTTLADGSTSKDREENDYTLILDRGAWKIKTDDQPNQAPPPGPPRRTRPLPPGSQV